MTDAKTLSDLLRAPAAEAHELAFIAGPGDATSRTAPELRERALRRLAALDLAPGAEVVMPIAAPQDFLEVLWASLLGGLVPMPLAPPTNEASCAKILDILGEREGATLVVDDGGLERLRAAGADEATLARRRWPDPADAPADEVPREPSDVAFVQYSSGSTRSPKGVIIRHGQALANLAAIRAGSGLGPDDRTLSWMPLSHDMGLVGFHLAPLFAGAAGQAILPTSVFARTPLVWLEEATARRSTILSSPNFGYRHALRAIARKGLPEDVDLYAVRLVMNGAEPISVEVAREFLERLAPAGLRAEAMFPVYGLAEATLAVTFPRLGDELRGLRVARAALAPGDEVRVLEAPGAEPSLVTAGCGAPLPGMEVRIAGGDGAALPEGRVGAIWMRGESVTEGYLDDAEATAAARKPDGWFDTGDLGFVLDGALFVTGRAKDLVIVAGQNLYPHDLEDSLCAALGLDPLRVAAAPLRRDGEAEELAVFVQHRGAAEGFADTAAAVRRHLSEAYGVAPGVVAPVAQIPRTTSGKVQRAKLSAALLAGEYDGALDALAPAEDAAGEPSPAGGADASPAALEAMMVGFCEQVLDGMRFGPTDNLFEQGMSSIDLAEIHGLIEARYPGGLDIRDFFDRPTIRGLAEFLSERGASGAASGAARG